MSHSFVDVLLDTLDQINLGSRAIEMGKNDILVSLGFRMGDEKPITSEDRERYFKLRDKYFQALKDEDKSLADLIGEKLFVETMNLIGRCFTSENAMALFNKLSRRWKM